MLTQLSLIRICKKLAMNFALLLLGVSLMHQSFAGCGQFDVAKKKPVDWLTSPQAAAPRFIHAQYRLVSDDSVASRQEVPINGLWSFEYISQGSPGVPNGTVLDHGITTWYSDGNEATSSGMRAPDTGSICLGVWKSLGNGKYVLNHVGLSWDPVNNVFLGPAFIKQYVQLEAAGNKYSGLVTITQYAADGITILGSAQGTIAATRISVDTATLPPP